MKQYSYFLASLLWLMGVFFFLDAATSACFVKEEDTLSTIFSKRYLQGTELVSTFDGTTDLPYGTNLEVLGAWSTAAANGWVLRVTCPAGH